ncbi:hypothetical protein DFH09DRAFT_1301767 [Mycena vulgaris]|nr:hypothetical protein DFH09DRAFT_1301767 [Mycena vulgaris]
MKLSIAIFALLPFFAAVAATPALNSVRSASEDLAARAVAPPGCSWELICSGKVVTTGIVATTCALEGVCPTSTAGCGANCMCELVCVE